jgi:hypothetical protein
MERYEKITIKKEIDWKPVSMYPKGEARYVVLEGDVGDLPRISAIRRWLTVYCLYDVVDDSIVRVSLTVKGERDE